MRRITTRGRSRIWRGVAVVGMSLGLTFVATTPSQAVTLTPPAIPLVDALPSTVIAGNKIGISGTVGATAAAGICATTTILCPALVIMGTAFMTAMQGLYFEYKNIPNSDIIGGGVVTFAKYPVIVGNNAVLALDFNMARPAAVNGTTSTNLRICTVRGDYTTSCNTSTWSANTTRIPASGDYTMVLSSSTVATERGILVQALRAGTSNTWDTVLSGCYAGRCETLTDVYPNSTTADKYAPNPPRRYWTETRCTDSSGNHSYIYNYSAEFYETSGTKPSADFATCPAGSRPTGASIGQQTKDKGNNWNDGPEDTVPGKRKGTLVDSKYPDAVVSPSHPDSNCYIGTDICIVSITKKTPTGPKTCDVVSCTTLPDQINDVKTGTITSEQSDYNCTYNGKTVSLDQCEGAQYDIVAATPSTDTGTNVDYNFGECGLNLACFAEKLFIPNSTASEARIGELKDAFYDTPFGLIPQAIDDFTAPFELIAWEPSEANCAGPTLTLPKNFGVVSTGIEGNYVIQPLYACPDTPQGKFAADISEDLRGILAPTVYVTGVFLITNTLLSAMGLALPMITRASEVDYDTGEITRRWKLRK